MIIVWGSVDIRPENLEAALEISEQHVRRSREEPGCISHTVLIDAQSRNTLCFFEEWADMPALEAHFAVAESIEFARNITGMAAAPPQIRIFDAAPIEQ